MADKRRKPNSRFRRPLGARRYHKLFIISAEGAVTEDEYFQLFRLGGRPLCKCLTDSNKSSPKHVLKRLTDYLKDEQPADPFEAWLVVDRNNWTDDQLQSLQNWQLKKLERSLAVSNPCFEFWLLLHFEDGKGVSATQECVRRLRKHLPAYNKHIDSAKFTQNRISDAIRRARRKDTPACADWPKGTGTTVYRLVANIRRELAEQSDPGPDPKS